MNKNLIIIALCGLMGLAFASCSHPSIVGTWVEPAAEGSLLGEVGFTLLENGEVKSINTGFREYQTWEKVGDKLILNGTTIKSGVIPPVGVNTFDLPSEVLVDGNNTLQLKPSGGGGNFSCFSYHLVEFEAPPDGTIIIVR